MHAFRNVHCGRGPLTAALGVALALPLALGTAGCAPAPVQTPEPAPGPTVVDGEPSDGPEPTEVPDGSTDPDDDDGEGAQPDGSDDDNGENDDDGDEEKPSTDSDGWNSTSDRDDPALKHAELPADFPTKRFPLPDGAVIDDAGARDDGWFVVLRAKSAKEADTWWRRVIKAGKFTVEHADESDGDRSATLVKKSLTVDALTIAQGDGTVLLSYDIAKP